MNSEELKALVDLIDASSLKYFEMTKDEFSIKMSKREVETEYKSTMDTANQSVSQPNIELQQQYGGGIESTISSMNDPQSDDEMADYHVIKAPIVGTSYLSSSPEASAFVQPGDKVTKGQTVLIIEAMKVMNEIKSDIDGVIKEVVVEDGQAVEFDQPLITIDTK